MDTRRFCCPSEQLWVWRVALADFISGDRIKVRHSAEQSTQDVLIKIVIDEEPEHLQSVMESVFDRRASHRARMRSRS